MSGRIIGPGLRANRGWTLDPPRHCAMCAALGLPDPLWGSLLTLYVRRVSPQTYETRALCRAAYCRDAFDRGLPAHYEGDGRLRVVLGRDCCRRCAEGEYDDAQMGLPLVATRMYCCRACGSKRCASAEDHDFPCCGGEP